MKKENDDLKIPRKPSVENLSPHDLDTLGREENMITFIERHLELGKSKETIRSKYLEIHKTDKECIDFDEAYELVIDTQDIFKADFRTHIWGFFGIFISAIIAGMIIGTTWFFLQPLGVLAIFLTGFISTKINRMIVWDHESTLLMIFSVFSVLLAVFLSGYFYFVLSTLNSTEITFTPSFPRFIVQTFPMFISNIWGVMNISHIFAGLISTAWVKLFF
ncbi:hypothetical protein KAU32_07005 [bacterium]|nr:hypothetical protein [bacterium]